MYKLEVTRRDDNRLLTPSFSSTLLDQIYRSIDEGERKIGETKFYRHVTMDGTKKQSRSNVKSTETDRKNNIVGSKMDRKLHNRHFDQDVMLFSSTSISSSSDSSSGGFSSSDTESMSRASCFAPRPKPLRTSLSFRSEKHGVRVFDGFCRNSNTEDESISIRNDEALIKSKSRALRIYNNLKKVKQPISPGGRVTSFLNSLFANTRKINRSTCEEHETKVKSVRASSSSSTSTSSTCSSASSFSRSCLSKTSSSERERLCNGVKRTVRFYPVSVIVGEDSRPCGHKRLYEEKDTALATKWKIGHSPSTRKEEEVSREFLKEYRHNQKKNNDLVLKDLSLRTKVNCHEDDDDASSYASSDLFELDHLAVFGSARYYEELPVYETTHVSTNRAIANGLIL